MLVICVVHISLNWPFDETGTYFICPNSFFKHACFLEGLEA